MTTNEWLIIIAVVTTLTTIIQCIEMYLLISSSRRTNQILEHPGPLVVSGLKELMAEVSEDKDFQAMLGGFVSWAGTTAIASVKQNMEQAGIKVPKIRSLGDALGLVFQLPGIQGAIEKKAQSILGDVGEAGAQATAAGSGW